MKTDSIWAAAEHLLRRDEEELREDVELSRACVKAWDSSGFTSNPMDAVHPMFSAAFELGYRASLAASAGSEPVAWRYVDARGHFRYVWYKPSRDMAAEYPMLKPIRLYLHPSPPEGMVGGWMPIGTAPKDGTPLLLRSKKGRIADGQWITATSSHGGWAWAYVNQEPVEWRPLSSGSDENRELGNIPAQAAPAAVAGPDRQTLIDVIAQGLSGTWHCLRVWNAWSFGTMSQDDFVPVDESDTPAELADAVLALLSTAPTAQEAPAAALPEQDRARGAQGRSR